jgi:hypothetical protein
MKYTSAKNKGMGWGVLIGVLSPWLVLPIFLYGFSAAEHVSFERLWYNFVHVQTATSRILSLCMIANLGWFYLFLNRERYGIARGIILGTLLYFPVFIYLIYG